MKKIFLNPVCGVVWVISFVVVYLSNSIQIPELIVSIFVNLAPLADGYRQKSEFPELSYKYFMFMQPISLVGFAIAWWPQISRMNYAGIRQRYLEAGVAKRIASWVFALSMIALGIGLYFLMGGQELPGTRINSSRIALAVFGPLAASGLSVFLAIVFSNILFVYIKAQSEK